MDKKQKSLIDDGQNGIILNESGTSVSLEDIDEGVKTEDSSLEDKADEVDTKKDE